MGLKMDWTRWGNKMSGNGFDRMPNNQDGTYTSQLDRIEEKLNWLVDNMQAKKKPKPRTAKKHEYDAKFLAIWDDYPTRSGANKAKAYAAYKKRLSETKKPRQLAVNIHIAVIKYAEFIQETGTWTKLPETFFGPSRPYLDDWTIPKKKPAEDPNKQHHPDFDANADTTIGLDPTNPYAGMK